MQKDFKIGLAVGLALVVASLLWLATRSTITIAVRMPPADTYAAQHHSLPSSPPATSDTQPPQTPGPANACPRYHTVKRGETLSAISKIYFGSTDKWQKILQANPAIKNANKLKPETSILIPD